MADESERQRRRRERQERINYVNDQERKRKQGEREDAAWGAAKDEQRQRNTADADWEAAIWDVLGESADRIQGDIDAAGDTDAGRAARDALRHAQDAARGGWLTSGNPRKARRILRQNKDKIKKAAKEGRSSRGCVSTLVLLGGSMYGLYEILQLL